MLVVLGLLPTVAGHIEVVTDLAEDEAHGVDGGEESLAHDVPQTQGKGLVLIGPVPVEMEIIESTFTLS